MIEKYARLADRIRNEGAELEREIQRAQKSWRTVATAQDPAPYIDSVALNLHGFYSGLERVFELIAEQVDESTPAGGTWHRDLLDQMSQAMPEVRPAIISRSTADELDELRKFRHLVRNVYTAYLDPTRMQRMLVALPDSWKRLKNELNTFAEFLDQLSHADEGDADPA